MSGCGHIHIEYGCPWRPERSLLQLTVSCPRVPGAKLWSSEGAVHAPNCWATSPAWSPRLPEVYTTSLIRPVTRCATAQLRTHPATFPQSSSSAHQVCSLGSTLGVNDITFSTFHTWVRSCGTCPWVPGMFHLIKQASENQGPNTVWAPIGGNYMP